MTIRFILAILLFSCNGVDKPDASNQSQNSSPSILDRQNELSELDHYSSDLKKFKYEKYSQKNCVTKSIKKDPDLSQLNRLPEYILQRIKDDFRSDNPNFNCKYKVVSWGCGSPCQMVAVFDSETGKLTDTMVTSFGVEFKLDSRLLILDPPLNTSIDTNYRKMIGEPSFWEMRNGQLQKLK